MTRSARTWYSVVSLVWMQASCASLVQYSAAAPISSYRVINTYPHDRLAFTQGLVFVDGVLFEGTGLYGHSSIRKVRLQTGQVLQEQRLAAEHFGEGITIWRDTIVQLTYQSGIGIVYDRATFQRQRTFTYDGDGWGLTHDGRRLIMSDGSSQLRFLDPVTFRELKRVTVRDGAEPVPYLNELEYVDGVVFANVWRSQRIARIAPDTGEVLSWIDLAGILEAHDAAGADVLNGIAHDEQTGRLFVSGKRWPKLFEIAIGPDAGINGFGGKAKPPPPLHRTTRSRDAIRGVPRISSAVSISVPNSAAHAVEIRAARLADEASDVVP